VDDAEKAYRYLLDEGGLAPEGIVLMGDSAGGGLAFALQMRLRDAGTPLPACSVTLSAWLDLSGSGQSVIDNEASDVFFDRADLPAMASHYLGETPAEHPGVSPLFGNVSGLPPALLQVSDSELLLDDSRRMARKLEAADVATRLHVYHEQPHVWQVLGGMLPEANEALDELGAFARGHLEGSPADRMTRRSPRRANA
jgi:acetyl esterase/lipase